MIRFYKGKFDLSSSIDILLSSDCIRTGENMWSVGKAYFQREICCDTTSVHLVPVENESRDILCYAYQDNEANRELRMLRELILCDNALHFNDVFPGIREVLICGCNELAYYFVKYLEKQHIEVKVIGQYWEWFGYKSINSFELNDTNSLLIYAEGVSLQKTDLYNTIIISVSSEFECIDKIYELNVQSGRIKDTEEGISSILTKMKEKKVIILGTDEKAQDTYDYLYRYGVDICCFAEFEVQRNTKTLLGKSIDRIKDILCRKQDVIFIDCHGKNSSLGTKTVEFFDYYGYARNEGLFLINDYIDIPFSNLVHVLKGKTVRFMGDEELCTILSDYFMDIEQGEVDVRYVNLKCYDTSNEEDIFFEVYPWFSDEGREYNPKLWEFKETLRCMDITYSKYFSRMSVFVIIDQYKNREQKKYTIRQLIPKGILLGRIPAASGNIFIRSILDGHKDILKWAYDLMGNNLFFYCIRLANRRAKDILKAFKKFFAEELVFSAEYSILRWDLFIKSMEMLLTLKDSFSSQELFIIFHIAYAEMMSEEENIDIGSKVIYWEPHSCNRDEFPFLAQWLEDESINGHTLYMHRDNLVRAGSCYKFYKEDPFSLEYINTYMSYNGVSEMKITYQYWEEFHMRFEDIKLHPKQELMRICDKFELSWSDVFLESTYEGREWVYNYQNTNEVKDFDLRPVFNTYEEYLSSFDRFRISLISRAYQKRYGYIYENSMKFSRRELQEMFLRAFRFQELLKFKKEEEKVKYFINAIDIFRWDLWETRKHEVLDDIIPIFRNIELYDFAYENRQKEEAVQKLIKFVQQQEKLVLYGTGKDCEALLKLIGERKPKIIFCDLKAACKDIEFHGNKVISPNELDGQYKEYKILITSSKYYKTIQDQLIYLFDIDSERIISNTYQLWEDEG